MGADDGRPEQAARREALLVEARAVERAAWVWSVLYRSECRRWRIVGTVLVVSAAGLAAAAGVAGLSQAIDHRLAAALALAAAGASAIGGALGASTRAGAAEAAAAADMALADAARTFHLTVAPYVPLDDAVARFAELCQHRDRVVATLPITHLPIHRRRFQRLWQEARTNQSRRLSEMEPPGPEAQEA